VAKLPEEMSKPSKANMHFKKKIEIIVPDDDADEHQ
jgi:hypothetical protein